MWILILTFHMGHQPALDVMAQSTGYDSKRGCELAGALVHTYFHARATQKSPNGSGTIDYQCVRAPGPR